MAACDGILCDTRPVRMAPRVMRMRMKRLGEPVETAILVQATFDRQDRMVDFRTETSLGGQAMISTGKVRGKRLEITTELRVDPDRDLGVPPHVLHD